MNDNGLITLESNDSPAITTERLLHAIDSKGLSLMARVDHAAAARSINLSLRPTEVFLFGNPKAGTPLMDMDQRVGIDLPLKMLIWEDELGKTKVSYNAPSWLSTRHHLAATADPVLNAMAEGLERVAREAAGLAPSHGGSLTG